jgi:hypothetical protein
MNLVHLWETLNTWYFYNFAFCWSFSPCSLKSVNCLTYVSSIYCACSLLVCIFFFWIKSIIIILCLNFIFYSLYVLNRSSFKNMLLYLSFSLSYTMNVNDVLYSVITYILHSVYAITSMCVCAAYVYRHLVRYFSYLLAMHQEISLSKIVYF